LSMIFFRKPVATFRDHALANNPCQNLPSLNRNDPRR
jgi:hypothetical protein